MVLVEGSFLMSGGSRGVEIFCERGTPVERVNHVRVKPLSLEWADRELYQ